MRGKNYRHATARPIACGGIGLPLVLMVPAIAALVLVLIAAT